MRIFVLCVFILTSILIGFVALRPREDRFMEGYRFGADAVFDEYHTAALYLEYLHPEIDVVNLYAFDSPNGKEIKLVFIAPETSLPALMDALMGDIRDMFLSLFPAEYYTIYFTQIRGGVDYIVYGYRWSADTVRKYGFVTEDAVNVLPRAIPLQNRFYRQWPGNPWRR